MIYPVSLCLIANAFLVHALSFPPARTLVAKAIDCSETKIWHQQTYNMAADIQDADRFVGLSPPSRAVGLMLAHLDDAYMVGTQNKSITDCELFKGSDMTVELFTDHSACAISFPFSKSDMVLKDPSQDPTFGLFPLKIEKLYQALRYSAKIDWLWAQGTSIQDVASATSWLFTITTGLPLHKHTLFQLGHEEWNLMRDVLARSGTSPVFFGTPERLFIITQPVAGQGDAWQGFDVSTPDVIESWSKGQMLQSSKDDYLIYHREHESLPTAAVKNDCDGNHPTYINGTIKVYPSLKQNSA